MPVKRVENVPLSQVPNLDRWITGWAKQVATIRVERHLIHCICRSIIVLNWFLASNVKYFDNLICAATCNACAIWMELYRAHSLIMVMKRTYVSLARDIPEFTGGIFRTWSDQSCIRRKHRSIYPVCMCAYCEHKSPILQLEHFEIFIVGTWE